jgi:hypothetical protein
MGVTFKIRISKYEYRNKSQTRNFNYPKLKVSGKVGWGSVISILLFVSKFDIRDSYLPISNIRKEVINEEKQ